MISEKNNKCSLSDSQASQQYFYRTYLKQKGEVFPSFSLSPFQACGEWPSSGPSEIRRRHVAPGPTTREWEREWPLWSVVPQTSLKRTASSPAMEIRPPGRPRASLSWVSE